MDLPLKGREWSFYRHRHHSERVRHEYLALHTQEGNGVLHVVFAGDYLPVTPIREAWNRYHGAYSGYSGNLQMDLQYVRGDDLLTKYLMKQYLTSQDGFIRFSMSHGWLWVGYRREWLNLVKHEGMAAAILLWNQKLEAHLPRTIQQPLS
jgi:hypothetical protein